MKYKLVIFDMDGTILDTLEDLADATNYALHQNGFSERTIDEIRRFVGNGIIKLIERACPENTPDEVRENVRRSFVSYYGALYSGDTKFLQKFRYSFIRFCMVGAMFAVIGNKRTADVFPDFIRRIFRTGAFDEFYNSISYKTAYFVNCALGKSVLAERIIRRIGKIP